MVPQDAHFAARRRVGVPATSEAAFRSAAVTMKGARRRSSTMTLREDLAAVLRSLLGAASGRGVGVAPVRPTIDRTECSTFAGPCPSLPECPTSTLVGDARSREAWPARGTCGGFAIANGSRRITDSPANIRPPATATEPAHAFPPPGVPRSAPAVAKGLDDGDDDAVRVERRRAVDANPLARGRIEREHPHSGAAGGLKADPSRSATAATECPRPLVRAARGNPIPLAVESACGVRGQGSIVTAMVLL